VTGDVTRDHYDRLAAAYDQNWAYSPQFVAWMTGAILGRLQPSATDVVLDLGCGTGLYARGLAGHAAAVVCADASAAMLAQLPADDRLVPVRATAQDVAARRPVLPCERFDAMLLKEVLHHVADPAAVIAGLAELLRPGGRMLVVMLPQKISYPLFAAALAVFAEHQPDPAAIAAAMGAAGLGVVMSQESFPLVFGKDRYLAMVRDRYMSLLSGFDDAALEAGVAEIAAAHPGELIEFTDTFAFVLGSAA
jgi:SAM-dependent methyltransferase